MLNHPTLDKLHELRLTGMARAWHEQLQSTAYDTLPFDERFAFLVEREYEERNNRRLKMRLAKAHLRLDAAIEDIDYRTNRGLDKRLVLALAGCRWVRETQNCIITGPTGAGKTYLACALGNKACREGFSVHYARAPRLLGELTLARADGRYPKLMTRLAKIDLLILDDWATALLTDENRRDMLEIMEDRYQRKATLVAAQLPLEHWHDAIGDPTLADAILDRLVHNAHKIAIKGESMRKRKGPLNPESLNE